MFKVFHSQVSPYHPDLNRYWLDDFQKVVEDGRNGLLDPSLPTLDELVHGLNKCRLQGNRDNALLVHMIMCKNGLESSTALGSALVSSLVELGSIQDACQVFNKLTSPNEQAWNSLILGFLDRGKLQDAFTLYKKLRKEKIPIYNGPILVALLKDCISSKDVAKGEEIHNHVAETGQLKEDAFICCTLVDMYMKCGFPSKAQEVFDKVQVQNVVMWNALISGYVGNGSDEDAVISFRQMLANGIEPNAITFVCILKALAVRGTVDKVVEIHVEIERRGLLHRNVFVGSTLVDAYAKCGWLTKAHEVFVKLQTRDVVSWTALISGHCEHGHGEAALDCFDQMQLEDVLPNAATYACSLKACACAGAVDKGREIHAEVARKGLLDKNIVLGSTLVYMYAKCGFPAQARGVFDRLPDRNVVSWTSLISGHVECEMGDEALKCLEEMQSQGVTPTIPTFVSCLRACADTRLIEKGQELHTLIEREGLLESNAIIASTLIDMYAKCGLLAKAQQVFDKLSTKDIVSWNTLITGYVKHGQPKDALMVYELMQQEGVPPNAVTYLGCLKACGSLKAVDKGEEIHTEIKKRKGLLEKDVVLTSTLVDMYVKCGSLAEARQVFANMSATDVVSWTSLISGYVDCGHGEEALECFKEMQEDGISPDAVTLVCCLKACSNIECAEKGLEIHAEIERKGFLDSNVVVGSTLVDMYAKCGMLVRAQEVFDKLRVRDVVTWTAMISNYAEQELAEEALTCFEQMRLRGVPPNVVTFTCGLKACGNLSATDKGQIIHEEIERKGLLNMELGIGSSLVDMYAKCGWMSIAQQVFDRLPSRDVVSWNALISGYALLGAHVRFSHIFERMLAEGIRPDSITLLMALNGCNRVGLFNQSESYFESVSRDYGIVPTVEHHNLIVDVLGRAGQLDKAMAIIKKVPFCPTLIMWRSVLGACRNWGSKGLAKDAFEHAVCLSASNSAAYVLMSQVCARGREETAGGQLLV